MTVVLPANLAPPALCSLCGHEQTEHVGCAHGWGPGSLAPGKGGCECDGPAGAEAELLALRSALERIRRLLSFVDDEDPKREDVSRAWIVADDTLAGRGGRAGDPPVVADH